MGAPGSAGGGDSDAPGIDDGGRMAGGSGGVLGGEAEGTWVLGSNATAG